MKAAYWFAKAKSAVAKFAVQILFCAPITVATELKGLILPRDDRYYCGLVVEAVAIK